MKTLPTLQEARSPLASGPEQLRRLAALALRDERGGSFERHLERAGLVPLRARGLEVLQLNLGKVCNQTCGHANRRSRLAAKRRQGWLVHADDVWGVHDLE